MADFVQGFKMVIALDELLLEHDVKGSIEEVCMNFFSAGNTLERLLTRSA